MKDESFVEKILYKLVKKHVSGTTMNSALEKTKELNKKDMHVSITFLSNSIASKSKAKYVTTTYQELARQISRMGLKASIQVPLSQMGFDVDAEAAGENIRNIIDTGNKYGVFVWAEVPADNNYSTKKFDECRGFGYAIPAKEIQEFVKEHKGAKTIKAVFNDGDKTTDWKETANQIAKIVKGKGNTVLLSTPDGVVKKLLNGSKPSKSIIFEFRLGDNKKGMAKLMKRGASVSVYLPFGKDWQAYAMNKVPEGYMRFLAGKFLSESDEQSGV